MKFNKTIITFLILLFLFTVMISAQTGVKAKVFLSSCYSNGLMKTELLNNNLIPLHQPYDDSLWGYKGTESVINIPINIVDWVLIELRSSATTLSGQRAAFLSNNGSVVDLDGVSPVYFSNVSPGNYYIVIKQRIHLGIISAIKVNLNLKSELYDFTDSQTKALGYLPMKDLKDGNFGMYAGDGDANGVVNALDYMTVENNIFKSGYLLGDLDMNASTNVLDYSQIYDNISQETYVPPFKIDSTAPNAPTDLSAVLQNVNVNPNLPRYSPFNGVQQYWGAYWYEDEYDGWELHALEGDALIVENPKYDIVNSSPSVFKVRIDYDTDYTDFAGNSVPRCEIYSQYDYMSLEGDVFIQKFKTFLPEGFAFDLSGWQQRMAFTQIWRQMDLGLDGSDYYTARGYESAPNATIIGSATGDVGKWVNWEIEFKASTVGGAGNSYLKIRKNGTEIYSDTYATLRTGNATSNPKWGIYKWDWLNYTTQIDSVVLYIDDLQVENITGDSITYLMDFGSITNSHGGGTSGDSIAHYINLEWTNPPEADHDSTYIFSSLTNDSTTAVQIAVVNKTNTTYRNTLAAETIRYYWLKARNNSGSVSSFSDVAVDNTSVYAPN